MNQDFQWGDPYTDLQAQNVQDGSVSYYDFDWGENVRSIEEDCEDTCRHPCAESCMPKCDCTQCEDNGETVAAENPDEIEYEIVQE